MNIHTRQQRNGVQGLPEVWYGITREDDDK